MDNLLIMIIPQSMLLDKKWTTLNPSSQPFSSNKAKIQHYTIELQRPSFSTSWHEPPVIDQTCILKKKTICNSILPTQEWKKNMF